MKLLEESRRLKTSEGEFKLALLIFEDLVAPVMVSFLVGLTTLGVITVGSVVIIFAKVVVLTAVAILFAYKG